MGTLYVDEQGVELDLDGERIVARKKGCRRATQPVRQIDHVVVGAHVRVTGRLAAGLGARGVGLVFLGGSRRKPSAIATGLPGNDSRLRLGQYRLLGDETRRTEISAMLIAERLARTSTLVADMRRAPHRPFDRAQDTLAGAIAKVAEASNRARLRGIEGSATARFFNAYRGCFASGLGFRNRNRRPPRDPVNVCLSLGYTLAHGEAVRIAVSRGFDPMLGVLHDLRAGHESLGSDLIEPVRPLVERWVWRLFADGVVRAENFSTHGQGCYLLKTGRREVYRSFEASAVEIRADLETRCLDLARRIRMTGAEAGALGLRTEEA